MKNCCKDCKNRKVGCHAICNTYIKASLERKKQLEEIHKKKSGTYYVLNKNRTFGVKSTFRSR